jgi:hypothetical protein
MSTHRISVMALFALTACPQNDATDHADEIGLELSSGTPDLPGVNDSTESTSKSTESTSDDDSESTEDTSTSDGSMDEIDGSTDDETGSEAVPTSLEVHSNGQRIGYLLTVHDYGFFVWDAANEVRFSVNDQTGHVLGNPASGYFTTPDCTGVRYEQASQVPLVLCDQIGVPSRRIIIGVDSLGGGWMAAAQLMIATGEPLAVNTQSVLSGGNCLAYVLQFCGFAVTATNVIPKTFALPITVVETQAVP